MHPSTLHGALAALGLVCIAAAMSSCSAGASVPAPTSFQVIVLVPTASPTSRLTPTAAAGRTSPPMPSPSPEATAGCTSDMAFDGDVTIMDGTVIAPGASFTKTWRLRNTGTCGWDARYTLVFESGDPLSSARAIALPATPPGQTVDVSIPMQAPETNGSYVSGWRLRSPAGQPFGMLVYVSIRVIGAATATEPGPTRTATPTATPTLVPSATARPLTATPTATASPTAVPPAATPVLPSYPGISGVTDRSRQIFLAGQQLGNRRNIFSKVGDSITVEWPFLGQIGEGYYHLANHTYLQPVITLFSAEVARTRNSFAETSLAAMGGWPSWAPLENWRSDPMCGGSTPLACEYSRVRPSVALIMLGTNDVNLKSGVDQFEYYLQQIVQKTVEAGIIPVLYTLPWCYCGDVGPFNAAVTRTARSFDVPLIDYYSAMEQGINHGIRDDGIHPSVPPDGFASNFDAEHLKYGYNIRNLLTLQALDLIWRQILSQ